MADMYVTGGGLNPVWVAEEQRRIFKKQAEESIANDLRLQKDIEDAIYEFAVELRQHTIEECEKKQNHDCNNRLQITLDELEAKFRFLKDHSDSEEDLNFAREILGLR